MFFIRMENKIEYENKGLNDLWKQKHKNQDSSNNEENKTEKN